MTDKTRIKSRPATRADIEQFYDQLPGQTVRARVLEQDGKVVGIAGYYLTANTAVVFSEAKEDIPKITIWREARAMMDSIKIPAICVASNGSNKFLERLGWQFMETSEGGDIYTWQP